jgi:WD40 repeat protein
MTPPPPTETPTPTPLPPAIDAGNVTRLAASLSFAPDEMVRSLAYSPDGRLLAAALGDTAGIVQLFDADTGDPVRALQGHDSIVWGVAFSPDGKYLASASKDAKVNVWDWAEGALVHTISLPGEVVSVAFSPDSGTLAAGGVEEWPNAAVWTFDVPSWQPQLKLAEFWNIPAIVFTPDGETVAAGGTSRNVRVWDARDGSEKLVLYHPGQVGSLAISPDGSTLASGLCEESATGDCTHGAVWLWDLASGRQIAGLSDFEDGVVAVDYSPDGSLLAAGSRTGEVHVYDAADRRLLHSFSLAGTSPASLLELAFSPDGRWLATGGTGGIELWGVQP